MTMMCSEYERFVFIVAEGATFDTEYHGDDCDMLLARQVLGDKWLEYEKKLSEVEVLKPYHGDINYTNCYFCGKLVNEIGITDHQRSNPRCIIKQKEYKRMLCLDLN